MASYRIFGDSIISEAEIRSGKVDFSCDPLDDPGNPLSTDGDIKGFTPIGKGKPLTVMIREVYTGRYPKKGILGGSKDVAVLSSVKNYDIFSASSRALNFIMRKAGRRDRKAGPSAYENGSALVCYSPAILTDSQIVSIQFAVDDFPGEFLDTVSGAFDKLGQIPLLLPHSGYLMAASGLIKIASGLGNSIFDDRAEFSFDLSIDFDIPGSEIAKADFRLLADDSLRMEDYTYDPQRGLIDRSTDKAYDGDEPYVILSLDGKKREALEAFKPTVASAEILHRFMDMKSGSDVTIDTIVAGVSLLSDMKYRERAEDVQRRIADTDDPDIASALESELDAIIANIRSDVLRP
ncbi:hypothetical protein [Novosphingobium mangrovi (ex Hu et al. 2023)]|uniref:Uncharacterized protein n=1 Tax=Novosphingobium mangrovi (ex Hu et al. 2023) TaxID=2930094 RepID=A0ABT0AII8_9SPHN|nr:hypothetical protein [Novosphingobium mangrovi (ex Hu et al. 2023)]MCJ1962982.1 hypothetical protein [Novosphingobium mangrovi (ex Hu et al. 2023)]